MNELGGLYLILFFLVGPAAEPLQTAYTMNELGGLYLILFFLVAPAAQPLQTAYCIGLFADGSDGASGTVPLKHKDIHAKRNFERAS
jgi:hypothetical protein